MGDKTDMDIFLENVPALTVGYKSLLTYLYHFIIFILVLAFLWWISSYYLLASFPAQFLVASGSTVPFMYIAKNFDKLREKYLKKYKKLPWQHFWFQYSYTSPLGCAAFYFPLFFITYDLDFLPFIKSLQYASVANIHFPYYSSIPIGIFVVIIGLLLVRPSQDHDRDMDAYVYIINPEKNHILKVGLYQYIRHPRFLSRLVITIGFGILANNLIAIGIAITHFLPYYVLIKVEDKELIRRYGNEAREYQKKVPALFPKFGNWKKFMRFIFIGGKRVEKS